MSESVTQLVTNQSPNQINQFTSASYVLPRTLNVLYHNLTQPCPPPTLRPLSPITLRDLFPYYFETMFGCALFCVFGCKVAASAYLSAYLEQVLNYDPDAEMRFYHTYEFLILLIWTAALFARILGVMDQITVRLA